MKKKLISILLIITILLSSLALSITSFASSQELYLNSKTSTIMSGTNDLEWFFYTPDQSGLYSLLSFNVPKCEAYLITKEVDPQTGQKVLNNLAYAGPNDPNYEENEHNEFQFCLTYHLEAGKTYYFAVGWYFSTQTRAQFTVMLRCDSYDENAISSIEISNVPDLVAYDGGEIKFDSDGTSFFWYDIEKLIRNMTVTINYSNGTSSSKTGVDEIDGYKITYIDNQFANHWYPQTDEDYKQNLFIVKVLDKTASCDVNIVVGAKYCFKGNVINFAGAPIKNALISIDGSKMAYTDDNGYFSFYISTGYKTVIVSTNTSINYKRQMTFGTSTTDLTQTPIRLCNCDYVRDGYINAKDYAYIIKHFSDESLEDIKNEFSVAINFSADKY